MSPEEIPLQSADVALENLKADLSLKNEQILIIERSVVEYAQIAIRWTIIGNGAIATGILTIIKEHAGSGISSSWLLAAAMVAALGAGMGFAATIFAYFSQWKHLKDSCREGILSQPGAHWEQLAGVICLVVGVVAFVIAVLLAAVSFYGAAPKSNKAALVITIAH